MAKDGLEPFLLDAGEPCLEPLELKSSFSPRLTGDAVLF